MKFNRCPQCHSTQLAVEKRLNGWYHCMDCHYTWPPKDLDSFCGNKQSLETTVFTKITASPRRLAEEFVGMMYDRVSGEDRYYSMLTGEFYESFDEALQATVVRLVEVDDE